MVRARRQSVVEDIASQPIQLDSFQADDETKFGSLLADGYLLQKLESLSVEVDRNGASKAFVLDTNRGGTTIGKRVDISSDNDKDRYEVYRRYIKQLDQSIDEFKVVLHQTEKVNNKLEEGLSQFMDISKSTTAFIDDTREIHDDKLRLERLNEIVPNDLKYFESLDTIIRRLNHATSPSIVKKDSFKSMLKKIDVALDYLHEHSDFKEAETYRIKYKQCLIRSCDLIVHFLNGLVKRVLNDIEGSIAKDPQMSATTKEVLLYNKFATIAEEYSDEMREIVDRRSMDTYTRYSDEIDSLLNECFNHYYQARKKLIDPVNREKLNSIYKNDEYVQTTRFIQAESSYFQQLCENEYQLFVKFFPNKDNKEKATQWLMQICDPFYDSVRSKLLKENNILTICDSINLFSSYYEFEEGSEEYEKQFKDIQYDKLYEPVMQKLQSRLIFITQKYIDEKIVKYKPPKDIFMISNRKKNENNDVNDEIVQLYIDNFDTTMIKDGTNGSQKSTENILTTYYRPVISTLALLSCIYEKIGSVVFDDLAHHIIHDCLVSLQSAFESIATLSDDFSFVENSLSYLRNLLFLRDELQDFSIQYTVNETFLDFSAVESLFKRSKSSVGFEEVQKPVLERRMSSQQQLFNAAKSLIPKLVTNMVDSRSEIIDSLRYIIRMFTSRATSLIIAEYLQIPDTADFDILGNNIKLRESIDENLPRLINLIRSYISSDEILEHLLDALKETIQARYANYFETLNEMIEKGSVEKSKVSEVMYIDTFAEYLNSSIRKNMSIKD
ncbi:Golgi transport complex subunit COG3 [Nakaseomyces bracarensis]|uniref:Golgi transport complex subunit COG3 n=1 Tax=Nakaseomyces bracarensis TaxID=273131 RepID=UPI003872A2E9